MRSHILISMIILISVSACSVPVSETKPDAYRPPAPSTQAPVTSNNAGGAVHSEPVGAGRLDHLDPNSSLVRDRSVYFEFDDAAVRRQDVPLIERHGHYLRTHQSVKVVIEGNTDERGGSEYNLALGQRRAEAVRSALRLMGVADAQVEAISFGEEKPSAPGHEESAWRRNRRADIAYPR